jgi:hypothetical protein
MYNIYNYTNYLNYILGDPNFNIPHFPLKNFKNYFIGNNYFNFIIFLINFLFNHNQINLFIISYDEDDNFINFNHDFRITFIVINIQNC